jgi:serine O-acetyltransferase
MLLTDKGLLALYFYRMAYRINSKKVGKLISRISEFLTGIEIYYNAKIGKGVEIWHGNGVVIGQSAVIGDDCVILQQVTVGGGFVKIGNNCKIGAGAKIIGNLNIEDGCVIGANSFVNKCFKKNSVVGGVPARVIKIKAEDENIIFGTKNDAGKI